LPAHELDDQDGEADSRRISGKSTAEFPEPTERGSPLPAGALQLELSRRGEVVGVMPLSSTTTTTIGRSATCDVRLDDPRVSRIQCRLTQEAGEVCIEDSGSGCGTFVNGQRVERVALRTSDRVYIADFVLTLRPA
jgi:pSer/pThr/pTyr-binding forkhead associated (FHA) protein